MLTEPDQATIILSILYDHEKYHQGKYNLFVPSAMGAPFPNVKLAGHLHFNRCSNTIFL
jgi:hypothetical protein